MSTFQQLSQYIENLNNELKPLLSRELSLETTHRRLLP